MIILIGKIYNVICVNYVGCVDNFFDLFLIFRFDFWNDM